MLATRGPASSTVPTPAATPAATSTSDSGRSTRAMATDSAFQRDCCTVRCSRQVDRPGNAGSGRYLAGVGGVVTTNPRWPETPTCRRGGRRRACFRRRTGDTAATSDRSAPHSGPDSRWRRGRPALPVVAAAAARTATADTRSASAAGCDWRGSRSSECDGSRTGARGGACAG